jgi:hypothetical protein
MIINASESHIVSGWIGDRGTLWVCQTESGESGFIRFSDAASHRLHAGSEDLFAAVHRYSDGQVNISAHRIEAPELAVSTILVSEDGYGIEGSPEVWTKLPRVYFTWGLSRFPNGELQPHLIFVDAEHRAVSHRPLDWFTQPPYDHSYQDIISVSEVPGSGLLLFRVQRSSKLVLYDPESREVVKMIPLADRNGSGEVSLRKNAPEVWVSDYKTLLRLDLGDWSVLDQSDLYSGEGRVGWIGSIHFNADESLCAVPRAQLGDVLLIDTESFRTRRRVIMGGDPFEAVVLRDGRVFARSIGTGRLLLGS